MGVLEALGGFFAGAARDVADLGGKAWQAIKSVYLFASTVFDLVGGAWDWMVNGLGWLGDNVLGGLGRILHLLEWLLLHAIPEGLSWAFNRAVGWAKGAIHEAKHLLTVLVRGVERFVLGELRKLAHWITGEAKRIWHTLTAAWRFIEHVGKRVADLVLHPKKIVAWILADLVLPLVRYLIEASAWLWIALFRAFRREAGAIVRTVEDVLAKLI